jgi:hypothetical protein
VGLIILDIQALGEITLVGLTILDNKDILHDYFPLKLIGKYLLLYNNRDYGD